MKKKHLRRKNRRIPSPRPVSGRKWLKAMRLFRRFWKLPHPPRITHLNVSGINKNEPYISLGRSPAIVIANEPKMSSATKVRRIRHTGKLLVTNADGDRLLIISKKKGHYTLTRGQKLLGWIPATEYVPSADMEKAGTQKRGKHWVHRHSIWPKVYKKRGGYVYEFGGHKRNSGKATYMVKDWIYG